MPPIKKSSLSDKLKASGLSPRTRSKEPLWKGPESNAPQGGITQSLLSRFLAPCRERFRLLVIEGLAPTENFNQRLEYGNMWHVCEEALSANKDWEPELKVYCMQLVSKYRLQQEEVVKWYEICKLQFPIYVDYWKNNPDVKERTPLLQEETFCVPYTLPSGRTVYLRGKFDAVDVIGKGKNAGIYLQENKSKGDIDAELLRRQLTFDLQTGVYLTALRIYREKHEGFTKRRDVPIRGIRYNVIRRPLSGGKHSIRQHAPTKSNPLGESKEEFYARLAGLILEDTNEALFEKRDAHYFMRWKVEVTTGDLENFQRTFLDPCLEQLCDWYAHVTTSPDIWGPYYRPNEDHYQSPPIYPHFRSPYGLYNPLLEGNATELDEYLASGSELGLSQKTSLFGELN